MDKNILITGGAGYVGTSLIPRLLEEGYRVRVFDNLMYGGEQLLLFFGNKNFEFLKGDITNLGEVKLAVKDQDVIIHLAAIVGFPACRRNPKLAEEVNVEGTKNIIAASSISQPIIFSSTGSNYGSVEDICTEETPLNPLSLYGQTKTMAEKILMERGNYIIYRFATAFGVSPRMRLDLLINDFSYKACTEGYLVVYEKKFKRTFIHVKDMASSFIFGIKNKDKLINNIFNIGSEKLNYSKEDICEILKKKVKLYVHYAEVGEDEDKRNYEVSYKKINQFGYATSVSVDEGIEELLKSFAVIENKKKYSNI